MHSERTPLPEMRTRSTVYSTKAEKPPHAYPPPPTHSLLHPYTSYPLQPSLSLRAKPRNSVIYTDTDTDTHTAWDDSGGGSGGWEVLGVCVGAREVLLSSVETYPHRSAETNPLSGVYVCV
jgi:hypothetical protein